MFFQRCSSEPCPYIHINACQGEPDIIIAPTVSEINDYQFSSYTNLQSIAFEEESECTVLGEYAFARLAQLATISLPTNVAQIHSYCFYECAALISIQFPATLQNIGQYAFGSCTSLTAIVFPDTGSIEVGLMAFDGVAMTNFEVKSSIVAFAGHISSDSQLQSFSCSDDHIYFKVIGGVLLSKDEKTLVMFPPGKNGPYQIPASVLEIGRYCFYSCTCEVSFPANIHTFGEYCFANWQGSTTVTIPASTHTIHAYAFSKSAIQYVYFQKPSLLNSLGDYAFSGSALCHIDFDPDCELDSIGHSTFSQCPIDCLTFPSNIKAIHGAAFGHSSISEFRVAANHKHLTVRDGVLYNSDFTTVMAYPPAKPGASYVFPIETERSNIYCFYLVPNLRDVSFPINSPFREFAVGTFERVLHVMVDLTNAQMLENIGSYCFAYNTAFVTIVLPDLVSSIGVRAFVGCSNLQRVTMPANLEQLHQGAFESCPKLAYVDFYPYCSLRTIPSQCFSSSLVTHLDLPRILKSVDPTAFQNTVVTLTFFGKPRDDVLLGFAHHTSLKHVNVTCEYAYWSPGIVFAGGMPTISVYGHCPTRLLQRTTIVSLLLHLLLV